MMWFACCRCGGWVLGLLECLCGVPGNWLEAIHFCCACCFGRLCGLMWKNRHKFRSLLDVAGGLEMLLRSD